MVFIDASVVKRKRQLVLLIYGSNNLVLNNKSKNIILLDYPRIG